MSGAPDSIERKQSIKANREAAEKALRGPIGRTNVGAWHPDSHDEKTVSLPLVGGRETPEPTMPVEALRRVYGYANVTTVHENGKPVAYRVRIGERNVVLRPSEALARLRRTDSVKYLRTRYAQSPKGILQGQMVSFAEASPLPMTMVCGIPDCPHDGVTLHADRSEPAVLRSTRTVGNAMVARSRSDRSSGSERGKHPRGSRNAEVLASDVPSLFCAAHGNRLPCPDGCADDSEREAELRAERAIADHYEGTTD